MEEPQQTAAANAWPHFVPRVEFDVELKDIHGRLQRIVSRLSSLEERAAISEEWVDTLRAKCRDELATKLELSTAESRLDIDVNICRQEIEEGLGDLRGHTDAHIASSREEAATASAGLRDGLASAGQERARLEKALETLRSDCAAAYVTKEGHSQDCNMLRDEWEAAATKLSEELTALEGSKGSRAELAALGAAIEETEAAARRDVTEALNQTAAQLRELDERFCSTFATRAMHDELKHGLALAGNREDQASRDHATLREEFNRERDKLTVDRERQAQFSVKVTGALEAVGELRDSFDQWRMDIDARSQKQERGLADLSSRKAAFLAQWKRRAEAQEQAQLEVQSLQETLRKSLDEHREAQKMDSERLRQQSTHRFIDQLDKAMQLKQSVDKVEQEQVKLSESMRTPRLPKL